MDITRRDFVNGTLASVAAAAVSPAVRGAPAPGPLPAAQAMPPIMLLGHDAASGTELAHESYLARQHALVVGDETERVGYFADLLTNATAPGGGGILVSADPDRTLYGRVVSACAAAGRRDDLLVLDFDRNAAQTAKSHTFNPFASASSHGLVDLVQALMRPSLEYGGNGAMWGGRSVAFLTGLLQVLVWKRDERLLDLTARSVADHSDLRALLALRNDPSLPENCANTLTSYLSSLPGFDPERGLLQPQAALDQHAYLQRCLADALSQIDAYRDILDSAQPDVVMRDVVERRRILLVILPGAGDAAHAAVGRLVLASFKALVADDAARLAISSFIVGSGLGPPLDGGWTAVDARPYRAPRPFVFLANDVDRYASDGMAILASQGRALNMSLIYGAASVPDLMAGDWREARSIIANTRTKIFLRPRAVEAIGYESVDSLAAMSMQSRNLGLPRVSFVPDGRAGSYAGHMEAELKRAGRLSCLDFSLLKPGEAFAAWDDKYRHIRVDRFPV